MFGKMQTNLPNIGKFALGRGRRDGVSSGNINGGCPPFLASKEPAMNSKNFAFAALLFCCAACVTEKRDGWDVLHKERIRDDYEVFLLKEGEDVLFCVEFKGQSIVQAGVYPDLSETAAVLYPFCNGDMVVKRSIDYNKNGNGVFQTVSAEHVDGTNVFYLDQDGDGFPENRFVHVSATPGDSVLETLVPQVVSSKGPKPTGEPESAAP